MRLQIRRYFGSFLFAALLVFSITLGATGGILFVYNSELPQVESLEDYRPNVITEVYGDGGQVIGSFALERRIIVESDQLPSVLKDAIVSVEDQNFYDHWGLDFYGISRAAVKNIFAGRVVEGGSTITQVLSENLFLSHERLWSLKVKEAMLSIQIERRYTKDEILTLYCNQIYLGHGMYGFAAAAEFYFGKNIQDLTIEEAALLAALPRAPSSYSPIANPERAMMRRNYVIDRMVAEGKIAVDEGEQAKQRPIRLNDERAPDQLAPYFVEGAAPVPGKHIRNIRGPRRRIACLFNSERGDAARREGQPQGGTSRLRQTTWLARSGVQPDGEWDRRSGKLLSARMDAADSGRRHRPRCRRGIGRAERPDPGRRLSGRDRLAGGRMDRPKRTSTVDHPG